MCRRKEGFTLIELSIVIVIIGLVVAGVVGGQTLIRQAALRAVITDLDQFKVAFNTFRLQYEAVPGDMVDAYSYWGSSCDSTASNCNGNGDGYITDVTIASINECNGAASDCETYRAWQHLKLAELIQGNFTGIGEGNGKEAAPGINTPVMAFRPAGTVEGSKDSKGSYTFRAVNFSYLSSGIGAVSMPHTNNLIVGTTNTNYMSNKPLFTPTQAQSIDAKADDGAVNSGRILGYRGGGSPSTDECISGGSFAAAVYNLSSSDIACGLQVIMD